MFWWLGLALFVDGIDGPIARKLGGQGDPADMVGRAARQHHRLRHLRADPAFALYQFGLMGEGLSFLSAAIIVVSSAVYYADTGMKTTENFFKGFPVVWNMIVFTLLRHRAGASGRPSRSWSSPASSPSCRCISSTRCG